MKNSKNKKWTSALLLVTFAILLIQLPACKLENLNLDQAVVKVNQGVNDFRPLLKNAALLWRQRQDPEKVEAVAGLLTSLSRDWYGVVEAYNTSRGDQSLYKMVARFENSLTSAVEMLDTYGVINEREANKVKIGLLGAVAVLKFLAEDVTPTRPAQVQLKFEPWDWRKILNNTSYIE